MLYVPELYIVNPPPSYVSRLFFACVHGNPTLKKSCWWFFLLVLFLLDGKKKTQKNNYFSVRSWLHVCRDHRREVNNNNIVAEATATTTRTARRAARLRARRRRVITSSWVCGRRWSGIAIPRLPSSSAVGSLNKAAMASCYGRSDGSPSPSTASSTTTVRNLSKP